MGLLFVFLKLYFDRLCYKQVVRAFACLSLRPLKPALRIGRHDCPLLNRSLQPSFNELINSS